MKEKTQDEKETSIGHLCCLSLSLEDMLNEVEGTLYDTVKSFKQVLYAFIISPDDIDGMADAIREARDEILEIELERKWSMLRELESRL